MFRREFIILGSLAGLLLLSVASVCFSLGRKLDTGSSTLAGDTLPGLINVGSAISLIQDNWFELHRLAYFTPAGDREEAVRKIRARSSSEFWTNYEKTISDSRDTIRFERMMQARDHYLQLRESFMKSLLSGAVAESQAMLERELTPAYSAYISSAKQLFARSALHGQTRAAEVMRLSWRAPFLFGAAGLVAFSFGLLLGLRGAFTGLHLYPNTGRALRINER